MDLGPNRGQSEPFKAMSFTLLSVQPDPWNTHVWKGTNGTPTKRRAIGFKKLAE